MGYSKIVKLGPGKVKAIHQLDGEGKVYAEDVTIESDIPGRLDYWEKRDGQVGVFNIGFTQYNRPAGMKFPDEA